MSIWLFIQIVLNILLLGGVTICLIKVFKDKEDDPRLTQGLRLLQSKISILEDLSDHTENQVKQLMMLLDKKLHEVRGTITQLNEHIGEVDRSIAKTKKMAEDIQNEMTHDQIVEKKLENKYIQAAQMAHQGHSVDEIVDALNLPKAEVELIARINKNKCVYENEKQNVQEQIFSQSLELPEFKGGSITQTNAKFHQVVQDHKDKSEFESIDLS